MKEVEEEKKNWRRKSENQKKIILPKQDKEVEELKRRIAKLKGEN